MGMINLIAKAFQGVREGRPIGLLILALGGAVAAVLLWFTIQDFRGELELTADVLASDRPWLLEENRGATVEGTVTDLNLEGVIEAGSRGTPDVTGSFGLIEVAGRSVIVASREALPTGRGRYHGTIQGLRSDSDEALLATIRVRRADPEIPPFFVDLGQTEEPGDRWLRVLMTVAIIPGLAVVTRGYIRAWRRRRLLGPPPPPPPPGFQFGRWYAGGGQLFSGSLDALLGVRELNVRPIGLPDCPRRYCGGQ